MERKQANVRHANTLNEYAKIAFPLVKTVCIFDYLDYATGTVCIEIIIKLLGKKS